MNKIKLILAAAVAVATMATGASAVNAQSNTCKVKPAALGQWGKAFTVNGTQVSASFTVEGTNCTTPVTLAVWERPTAEGINDQKLFKHVTKTFGPGRHSLSSQLPNCMYQADVVEGASPTAADGTANYQFQNGKFVDGGLRDFIKGGAGVCKTPEKPVQEIPETPQTPQTPQTPATPQVKALPSTGAGSILASTMGLSTTAGVAVKYFRSRKALKV